ncbi:MAG: hypothetical protein ACRD2B_12030 [Terriglobia bacterium]
MSGPQLPTREMIPVHDYVREPVKLLSHLPHDWEMHAAVLLTPAEERTMVREPIHAVPASVAERLGKVRIHVVPYVGCFESGDAVCFSKPEGETHSAVWVEVENRTHLFLACRELDAHDTGFELLASIAQLLQPKLTGAEDERYEQLLGGELAAEVGGEIDKEALSAKEAFLKHPSHFADRKEHFTAYRDASFASTMAEYMHGLWHDVQIRTGPEHLPVPQLRSRMALLAQMFPPNPGYRVFAREVEESDSG